MIKDRANLNKAAPELGLNSVLNKPKSSKILNPNATQKMLMDLDINE